MDKKGFFSKISSFIIRQINIISILIFIIAIALAGKYIFQFGKINKEMRDKISQKEEQLKTLEEESSQIKNLLANYQKVKEDLKDLELVLPKKDDLPGLFVTFERLAEASNLAITSISISEEGKNLEKQEGEEKKTDQKIKEFKISLAVQQKNGTYQTLKKFLDNIERNMRFLDISSIDFASADNKIESYTINLKTYSLN